MKKEKAVNSLIMKRQRLNIKPLSVNRAWQGRRFKTNEYKSYEQELFLILPNARILKTRLKLEIIVGFSNKRSDLSNIIKPFEDVLCKKYNIDDSWNYELVLKKEIVKKGDEFIEFEINNLN